MAVDGTLAPEDSRGFGVNLASASREEMGGDEIVARHLLDREIELLHRFR
jgi:hypothetical protein